jgi:hypothetical protein
MHPRWGDSSGALREERERGERERGERERGERERGERERGRGGREGVISKTKGAMKNDGRERGVVGSHEMAIGDIWSTPQSD